MTSIAKMPNVAGVAGGLTLTDSTVLGKMPSFSAGGGGGSAAGAGRGRGLPLVVQG